MSSRHTFVIALLDDELARLGDARDALVNLVREQALPVVHVGQYRVDMRLRDGLAQQLEKGNWIEDAARPSPKARDAPEARVDVLVRVPDGHHREVDLLDVAQLDEPGKEADDPTALVVGGVVELRSTYARGARG